MRKLRVWKGIVSAVGIFVTITISGCAVAERVGGISQARELQAVGEKATATILEIWDTHTTINDDPVIGFLLEVQREGRPAYQVKTKLLISRIDVPRVQPGAVVPVRIDPRDPNRVALDIYDYGKNKKSD